LIDAPRRRRRRRRRWLLAVSDVYYYNSFCAYRGKSRYRKITAQTRTDALIMQIAEGYE